MSVSGLIENRLEKDADGVWVRDDAKPFAYTDGRDSELHLERVFAGASDLSSTSYELTGGIKDWPSEYHLTPARAQLLRGFEFDRAKRVLEVGCGCGAITRFLGETFDRVIAVEGSHARARLARMRTRDLDHVEIVNSPFEEIRFTERFDLIFCIGVFEYAGMFVASDDPYRRILRYFDDLLAPEGALVIAIENKLGLKYFSSSAEDHNGVMFDGIEGYPRFDQKKARTFGREELTRMLRRHFDNVDFYYPWPDYKIPSCVLTEEMLTRVDPSELIGSFRSVDYGNRGRRPLFNEALAWRELAANGLVPAMAHSFLVAASKGPQTALRFDSLGRLYNGLRRPPFRTVTRFETTGDGVRVVKERADGRTEYVEDKLIHRACSGDWIDGASLQHTMARRSRARGLDLKTMLEPATVWFDDLKRAAGEGTTVPGDRLDSIWRNCFPDGERCRYIDREWAWAEPLPLALVVARGLYYFAQELRGGPGLNPVIAGLSVDGLITGAAAIHEIEVDDAVLSDLVRFEAAFLGQVSGGKDREADVAAVLKQKLESTFASSMEHLSRRGARWLKRRLKR